MKQKMFYVVEMEFEVEPSKNPINTTERHAERLRQEIRHLMTKQPDVTSIRVETVGVYEV